MNRGLYIGATSLVVNQKKLDVLSNNLANVNTAGYKKDISLSESFPEKLLAKMSKTPEFGNIARGNNIIYENNNGVHTARTEDGYFVLETTRGKSYVKEIKVVADEEGNLKTYYKDLMDENKTDYENYLIDDSGNRIQEAGDMENMLQGIVFTPPSYVVGTMSGGVRFQKIFTDFTHGGMMDTGGELDLAIKGDGFFKIQGDGQTLYTRNGSFAITDGYLTDLDGRRVLGRNGAIPLSGGNVDILENGQIQVDGNVIDTLDVVNINNKEFLRKMGDNLFYGAENANIEENPFEGEVLQGYLEGSNMNPISGMVEMINLLRDFETGQKAIKMQDEMLEKAATEIGRV
ncbi:flagellar hook-basal body protein [Tissierella sp. MB52-C2]|uniref:flagellar hook-basal body protein n=1 Tax=Tissierella sp. MB52-C2 TaxID=3070999 RepID=UPI00280A52E7|nr:flagellar hook-basal body protein [Tissierella sp. MB52-C2]WMM24228.1 flagellar hook-basal body protein [Tissierella sp. MB52-C2]